MDRLIIRGGNPLSGEINIDGAKNACLPIMACALLTDEKVSVYNVPNIRDIISMQDLLESLGASLEYELGKMIIHANSINNFVAHYDFVRKMRASFWTLAPLLARFGYAKVSMPGGCAIGVRGVDMHLQGLEAMGAKIEIEDGYVIARSAKTLKGTNFHFNKVSVGATLSIIMAAAIADGRTKLTNCAIEPEILDVCHLLLKMGANISGVGTHTLNIEGVKKLNGTNYTIIPDRIEAGTYIIGAAITGGELTLNGIDGNMLDNLLIPLQNTGISIICENNKIKVNKRNSYIKPINISTNPYPGFSTDLQAQFMALMTIANGSCTITENIFENRFMHVPELCRMGAKINLVNNVAYIDGVKQLKGANVMASDLRASVALVLAGLAAKGSTIINRIYHIDRGYSNLVLKLQKCGIDISKVKA